MFVKIFCVLIPLTLVFSEIDISFEKCSGFATFAFYDELGCVPSLMEDNCPITFDCSHFRDRDSDSCNFKNTTVEVGGILEYNGLENSCISNCYCHNRTGIHEFDCTYYDCFDNEPPADDCFRMHSLTNCCGVDYVCGTKDRATCNYLGETYLEGNEFITKNKDYRCVCTKDFEEDKAVAENKNCAPFFCGFELHNESELQFGCLPILKESVGCPWIWHCPSEKTDIYKSDGSETVCHFGNQTLSIGDVLEQDTQLNVNCTCLVPPMIQCIEYVEY
ncbi:unnamed protein product [Diamesa serratosioi]